MTTRAFALIKLDTAQGKKALAILLERAGGDISRTAKMLGVGRTSLYRWIAMYPDLVEIVASERKAAKKAREKARAER